MIYKFYNWIKRKLIWIFIGGIAIAGTVDVVIVTDTEKIDSISNRMEIYYDIFQDYPQIKKGDTLNGKNLSDNYWVNEYETWTGERGYEIQYETDTQIISKGFGVQAEQRTWTKDRVFPIASTTP